MNATAEATTQPTIRLVSGQLYVGDESVKLSPAESVLMTELLANAGTTLPRQHLENAMYGTGAESASNVVEVLVSRLRRKLRWLGQKHAIETVRLHGYRFVPVQSAPAPRA